MTEASAPRSDAGRAEAPSGPVAVLGAGTMGHGIAQVAAMSGRETRLFDVDLEVLEAGLDRVRENLDGGVERGKVEPGTRERALSLLSPAGSLAEAASGAEAVIEAVPERLGLKREVLAEAAGAAAPGALLATNTSSLSITEIGRAVPSPARFVGMHFFNPVHIMELVEVVRGQQTSGESVARAESLARALGKTPVVVRDSPGFASSRLGVALGLEAIRMVETEVASAEDIDRTMELGYRHPMGPLKLTDLVGLDVRLEIARYLHDELEGGREGGRFEPPALLERMVAEGKLGKKSGEGFYDWEDGS